MSKHAKADEETALQHDARMYAEGATKGLTEEQVAKVAIGARAIKEGLSAVASEGTPEEIAARVAIAFASLLAMMCKTPAGDLSDVLDHSIAGYAMAAGSLVGVYEMPDPPVDDAEMQKILDQVKADLEEHREETALKYL